VVHAACGLIAPDNYQDNLRAFENVCAAYSREDNPLFVPESVLKGPHKLRAIAEYNAIGYFGEIRTLLGKDGNADPDRKHKETFVSVFQRSSLSSLNIRALARCVP